MTTETVTTTTGETVSTMTSILREMWDRMELERLRGKYWDLIYERDAYVEALKRLRDDVAKAFIVRKEGDGIVTYKCRICRKNLLRIHPNGVDTSYCRHFEGRSLSRRCYRCIETHMLCDDVYDPDECRAFVMSAIVTVPPLTENGRAYAIFLRDD